MAATCWRLPAARGDGTARRELRPKGSPPLSRYPRSARHRALPRPTWAPSRSVRTRRRPCIRIRGPAARRERASEEIASLSLLGDRRRRDTRPHLDSLVEALFRNIPCGVGQTGRHRFNQDELKRLLLHGSRELLRHGLAIKRDIEFTESHGCLDEAEPGQVSKRALERGEGQCGTLGGGNHFLEVQVVQEVFDDRAAHAMGLGACWLAIHPIAERVEGLRKLLNLPEHLIPLNVISLGRPAQERKHPDRYDEAKVSWNRFPD